MDRSGLDKVQSVVSAACNTSRDGRERTAKDTRGKEVERGKRGRVCVCVCVCVRGITTHKEDRG